MRLHRTPSSDSPGASRSCRRASKGCRCGKWRGVFSVSPPTVCRWDRRWRRASEEERSALACLLDRSSRPEHTPRLLPASAQRRICAARRLTGWGPRLLSVRSGHRHSTISKVLPPAAGCSPTGPPKLGPCRQSRQGRRPDEQYLLSLYQPEGDPPAPEVLERIMRDLD
jgi:hypothetical protein